MWAPQAPLPPGSTQTRPGPPHLPRPGQLCPYLGPTRTQADRWGQDSGPAAPETGLPRTGTPRGPKRLRRGRQGLLRTARARASRGPPMRAQRRCGARPRLFTAAQRPGAGPPAGRGRSPACPIPNPAPRAPPVRTSPGTASQSLHLRQEVETQREPRIPLRGPAYSLASSAPLHPQLPGSGARPETMRVAGSCGPRAEQQPPEVLPAPASRDAAAGPAPSRSSSAGPLREPSRVLVPVRVRGVRGSQEGAQGVSGPSGRWRRQCGSPRRGRAAGLGPLGAAGYNSSFHRAAARGDAGRSPGGRISHDEARIGNGC